MLEAALKCALTTAVHAGSDTSATAIAHALVMFNKHNWLTHSLVKACLQFYLPQLFEFLLNHNPDILNEPGEHNEPSIKQMLSVCSEHQCFENCFYVIVKKIERKYMARA